MLRKTWSATVPMVVGGLLVLGACTSEKIVFQDREPFNPPPDAASGFLGYFDVSTQQTTCGNCHAETQGAWKQTRHAKAYATLAARPANQVQATCYNCHTVTSRGNAATSPSGYEVVKDSAYRDVQCESCHGPGLTHVEGVGQANLVRPLAKVGMTGDANCGECHSGVHTPFLEEWSASGHAKVEASRAGNTNSGCASCHDGRGALKAWGQQTNYVERDQATAYQPTTCSVCHDPHGSPNTHQLRFPIESPDPEQNLCMKCHMRRFEPTATQSSPHAPQGALLLGLAGYRPAGFGYDEARIFGSHASDRNPKLCAGCHVARFTVNDPSGNFVFQATGHLFRPVPCLDAEGKPTADENCAYSSTARSWGSCTAAGCHASAAVAASLFATVRSRLKALTDQLWVDTNASGSLQAAPTDQGMLPTVRQTRATEWSTTDNRISPAEGAEFNARLCGEYGQSNSDNSKGVHNPFLCEALLIATIAEVRATYNLPAPPAAVAAIMNGPVGGPFTQNLRVSNTPVWR